LAKELDTKWKATDPVVVMNVKMAENIRQPQAEMPGVNELFRPRGSTVGGIPELIMDPAYVTVSGVRELVEESK
jgi:hypothetical protein